MNECRWLKWGLRAVVCFLPLVLFVSARARSYPDTASISNIGLWPGEAPGSENASATENYAVYDREGHRAFWNIRHPMMTAFYAAKPTGTAVLVIPGGGYKALYFDDPPVAAARWLNTLGIDAFVLKHRLPNEGHKRGYDVPLQDAQRAMRIIRSGKLSGGHTIDPARIGVMGFSAGGHLAAMLGTFHDASVYDAIDAIDALSARPDFMVLGYPPIPSPHDDLGTADIAKLFKRYDIRERIGAATPAAFVFAGDNDRLVPYSNSVDFAEAMKRAGAPVELHIFPGAGHSIGFNGLGPEAAWRDLCVAWMRARGLLPATP